MSLSASSHQRVKRRLVLLFTDPVFLAVVAISLLLSLPFLLPGLDRSFVEWWAVGGFDIAFLPIVFIVLATGRGATASRNERSFWRLLQAAVAILWVIQAWEGIGSVPDGSMASIVIDALYLAHLAVIFFAASLTPHRGEEMKTRPFAPTQTLAVLVTLGSILTYFVLIPAQVQPELYASTYPSMLLLMSLDAIAIFLFARLYRETERESWRAVYSALTAAAVLWLVVDTLDLLDLTGTFSIELGSPVDLLWSTPAVAIAAASRLRALIPSDPADAPSGTHALQPLAQGFSLVAVVALPLLHFGYYALIPQSGAMKGAREVVLMLALAALGLLAWLERRNLARERATARKERDLREAELRASEARYRSLVDDAPEAIFILDLSSGRFVDANPRALEMFGYSLSELRRLGPIDVSPEEQPDGRISAEAAPQAIAAALEGPISFEWVHIHKTGREVYCELYISPMPGDGQPLLRGAAIDITERRRLKAELRQAQKMETIGRLAGGVAHDFNNLLTVINGYSQEMLTYTDLPEQLREPLSEIHGAGERAAQVTRQLLAVSRKQVTEERVFDVNVVLGEMNALIDRLLGETITLGTELAPEPCYVRMDRGQLEQAFLNLVVNAKDAMPSGGRITITTAILAPVATRDGELPEDRIEIRVDDTGVGMDQATLERAFEPFFTTKERDKGSGLGLSTVFGFITQSGGTIDVTSKVGAGSSFKIRLPRWKESPTPIEEPPQPQPRRRGEASVLVVEDEASVRRLIRQILEGVGYRVAVAASGAEATRIIEEAREPFDLLVTDVVLPKETGIQIARRIRERTPEIPVLLISGYMEDILSREDLTAENFAFLPKPFGPDMLTGQIAEMLGAAPSD